MERKPSLQPAPPEERPAASVHGSVARGLDSSGTSRPSVSRDRDYPRTEGLPTTTTAQAFSGPWSLREDWQVPSGALIWVLGLL